MKAGSASLPLLGIDPVILDSQTGQEVSGHDASGVLCIRRPWPGMARTIYGDHERYMTTYFQHYKGKNPSGRERSKRH